MVESISLLGCHLDDRGTVVQVSAWARLFIICIVSNSPLNSTQSSLQRVPVERGRYPSVKRPERVFSSLSTVEVKKSVAMPLHPQISSWHEYLLTYLLTYSMVQSPS